MASETLLVFLRHGHSTANERGVLAGRDNSVSLSERGLAEARACADRLSADNWDEIRSSPITRCIETLKPLQLALRTTKKVSRIGRDPNFQEMDYGTWSGKKLSLLAKRKEWQTIQSHPSAFRFPGGESFREAAFRIQSGIDQLPRGKRILICSHGDIIKLALTELMGAQIDNFQRLSIDPGSLSSVAITSHGPRIIAINDTSHIPRTKSAIGNNSSRRVTLGGGSR